MPKKKPLFILFLLSSLLWSTEATQAQPVVSQDHPHFAATSPDGILFRWDKRGNNGLYLILPGRDTLLLLSHLRTRPQHPVWVPGKEAIVFDTGVDQNNRLVYYDLKTKQLKLLLHRKIACREASFTPSRHLVAFSGFDDRTGGWQIFSYDFIYGNLNRLTSEKGNCLFPVFSPDGKTILYTIQDANGHSRLKSINWYGNNPKILAKNIFGKACWTPDNWRILFVEHYGNRYLLKSIHRDGTGTAELLSLPYPACCPVEDKNGNLWLLVKPGKTFILTGIRKGKVPVKSLQESMLKRSTTQDVIFQQHP